MTIATRLAALEKLLQSIPRPRCPACAGRPLMSENPADGEPCLRCGRRPEHFTLIRRTIVRTREDIAAAIAEARQRGDKILFT